MDVWHRRPGGIREVSTLGAGGDSPTLWDHAWVDVDLDKELARFRAGEDPIGREIMRWTRPGSLVLEAGCGSGRILDMLSDAKRLGIGVDFAAGALSKAKALRPTLHMMAGDVQAMPFRDGTFDALLSLGLVEHFQKGPAAVLDEHRRVLRTGGTLIITVPRISPLKRAMDARLIAGRGSYVSGLGREIRRVSRTEPEVSASRHSRFYQYEFSDQDVIGFVRAAGFLPMHWHALGIGFGLSEVRRLGSLIRHSHSRWEGGAATKGTYRRQGNSRARGLTVARDLFGSELGRSWYSRRLLAIARRLCGHVLLIVAQADG